jgi:hypothetical protein
VTLIELLLGQPLATEDEKAERIGAAKGIPIFGLDALSSAAYGPEAALTLLIPLGAAGGVWPGLLAAASLMVDYVLTAAVGISAGVGALVSAVPSLQTHTLIICVGILALLTVVNLRGVQETGGLFPIDATDLGPPLVVLPIERWDAVSEKALRFAWTISPDIQTTVCSTTIALPS